MKINNRVVVYQCSRIANPTNITPNSQMSLRGATLVATKQSIKVTRNGLLRRLTPPRNDVSLLWVNSFEYIDG